MECCGNISSLYQLDLITLHNARAYCLFYIYVHILTAGGSLVVITPTAGHEHTNFYTLKLIVSEGFTVQYEVLAHKLLDL